MNENIQSICEGTQTGFADNAQLQMILNIIIGLLVLICGVLSIIQLWNMECLTKMNSSNQWLLVSCSIWMICISGLMSQIVHIQRYDQEASFNKWFNGLMPSTTAQFLIIVGVGMVKNVVFGFLDNAGLFFGSNFLDEVFEKLPGASDANVFAGQGNTQSDFVGAFLGTFCGFIMSDLTDIEEAPFWTECIGIVIGCLFGILIPKLIMGNNSDYHGINRINAKQTIIGGMEKHELNEMLSNNTSFINYKINSLFAKIDTDNSNTLDQYEIKNFLKASIDNDQDIDDIIKSSFGIKDIYSKNDFKQIFINLAKSLCKEKQGQDGNHEEYLKRKKLNNKSKSQMNGKSNGNNDLKNDEEKLINKESSIKNENEFKKDSQRLEQGNLDINDIKV